MCLMGLYPYSWKLYDVFKGHKVLVLLELKIRLFSVFSQSAYRYLGVIISRNSVPTRHKNLDTSTICTSGTTGSKLCIAPLASQLL